MGKVLVNETSLQGIANSIRGKNGTETTYKPSEMAAAIDAIETGGAVEAITIESNGTYTAPEGIDGYSPITVNVPQDGSPPDEAFLISNISGNYIFYNGNWDWFIEKYGNQIITENITSALSMFDGVQVEAIPFEINFKKTTAGNDLSYMFNNCHYLTDIPKINNCKPNRTSNMFYQCRRLRYLPEDIGDWFDWSWMQAQTGSYNGDKGYMFVHCRSLRSVPMNLLMYANPNVSGSYTYFHYAFSYCYALDEVIDLPIPYTAACTSNNFTNTFQYCNRLKNITFAMPNGQPYIMNWKSQTISLDTQVGYTSSKTNVTSLNSGITDDKLVTDDATYQALKDDPDWFATNIAYSRYNHDSAVATINSLPDTSAYLATAGGTNTIKFKGESGSATDGGAINTLTEEEIAVATARGWTVTLV